MGTGNPIDSKECTRHTETTKKDRQMLRPHEGKGRSGMRTDVVLLEDVKLQ